MKNISFFFVFIFLLHSAYLNAQNSIIVTYEKTTSEEVSQLADIMDVKLLILDVKGDLKGKKLILRENKVNDDIITSKIVLTSDVLINYDTITINVMSRNITADSVKIDIRSRDLFYYIDVYNISNNNNCILMETILSNSSSNNIPIFAYTTGIQKKIKVDGQIFDGIDYCGLRYADTSPALWNKKYKISNYIYFTIDVE